MTDRWIAAYVARQMVADRRNAWDRDALIAVERAIIDYARTVLPARCQYMWDKTLKTDAPDTTLEYRDAVIPRWTWNLATDVSVDWEAGIFHLAGNYKEDLHYVKIQGLEFDVASINRIWPTIANKDNSPPTANEHPKGKGGAQPKLDAWHTFWMEAMTMLHEGELHDQVKYPSQRALRDELLSRLNDQLGAESVKPLISRIWHTFREGT